MSGRHQPQPLGPFNPPGRVLFRLSFNVDNATEDDFDRFIQQVEQEILNHMRNPRYCGTAGAAVLPYCRPVEQPTGRRAPVQPVPRAQRRRVAPVLPVPRSQRTWFVIVLETRDRGTTYRVPFFIEAETVYLRGYQNQAGNLFEFAPDISRDHNLPARSYLGNAATALSFNCNYGDIVRSTAERTSSREDRRRAGDPGLILQPLPAGPPAPWERQRQQQQQGERPRRSPNFGQERLRVAVRELAQANNDSSQHRTAQNLLLVIVRFCESIRLRNVRREMVELWTVEPNSRDQQPSRGLSGAAILVINNWSTLSQNLLRHERNLGPWPTNGVAGIGTADEAQGIVVLVQFSGDPNEAGNRTPEWVNDDNADGRQGGPGAGRPGPSWGADAAAVTPPPVILDWYLVPEEPATEILGVLVPHQQSGVYGNITVTDCFGAQSAYSRDRAGYQRSSSGDSAELRLELNALNRAISAYGCFYIDVDLWSASTGQMLSKGRISWSRYNFWTNLCGYVLYKTIGQARLVYIVYRKAVQVAVTVTVDNGGDDDFAGAGGSFTATNTRLTKVLYNEPFLPPPARRPMVRAVRSDRGPHVVLYGEDVVAAPLEELLSVTVSLLPRGARRRVAATFELEPTEASGSTTKTSTLQQGGTVTVSFAWSLLPMGLSNYSAASDGQCLA
ncbi:uncharacterized protein LOC120644605 [Panicum virgatum]|uniref:rRNA N-glycosylase n=1 Tax=Panicum virgatum TaxID=38727 RepID=A0A8T0PJH4_PANVG|nr:uncharacterized protein LOC120644605 [Panicum virgatum]KAG2562487.1 hypothetical protein PVAP13_8KG234706 [Panicum virgatum]